MMIVGLLAIPFVMLVGLGVDFSRASTAKFEIGKKLDSVLLYSVLKKSQDDSVNVQQLVNERLAAMWHFQSIPMPQVTVTELQGNYNARLTGEVETAFMRIVGHDKMNVAVESEASANAIDLELALVLDNTGSMSGSKLSSLKSASKELVDTLIPDTTHDNVKIALVPFSQYVNVGVDKRGSGWLDVPDDQSGNYCKSAYSYEETTESNCVSVPSTCYNDGVPYSCNKNQCDSTPTGNTVNVGESCYDWTANWNGCVTSRMSPLDEKDVGYGNQIVGYLNNHIPDPAHPMHGNKVIWSNACPKPISDLNDNPDELKSAIDEMTAQGYTYIPTGLMWGWRALSSQAPFDKGAPKTDKSVKKAVLLMTDGENTIFKNEDGSEITHDHSSDGNKIDESDQRLARICAAMKDPSENIHIYTVAFEVTDASTKALLQSCATSSSDYYDASDPEALETAFRKIAESLINLRLTK